MVQSAVRGAVELSPSRAAGKVVDRDNVGTFGLGHARVRFTVGEDELEATGGDIVVVPAGVAHGFTNVGAAPDALHQRPSGGPDADGVAGLRGDLDEW